MDLRTFQGKGQAEEAIVGVGRIRIGNHAGHLPKEGRIMPGQGAEAVSVHGIGGAQQKVNTPILPRFGQMLP